MTQIIGYWNALEGFTILLRNIEKNINIVCLKIYTWISSLLLSDYQSISFLPKMDPHRMKQQFWM